MRSYQCLLAALPVNSSDFLQVCLQQLLRLQKMASFQARKWLMVKKGGLSSLSQHYCCKHLTQYYHLSRWKNPHWSSLVRWTLAFQDENARTCKLKCLECSRLVSSWEYKKELKQKTVSRCGFDGQSLPQGLQISGSIYWAKLQMTSNCLQII